MLKKIFKNSVLVALIIVMVALTTLNAFAVDTPSQNIAKDTKPPKDNIITDNIPFENIPSDNLISEFSIEAQLHKNVLVESIINDSAKGVLELQEAILEENIYAEGMAKKHEIDNVNYFKTAVKLKYPEISDYDLGKTVLLALGDSEEFIEGVTGR